MSVIFIMGVIAMLLLSMMGSFLVGRVGGAEKVGALREDLIAIFGGQMEDPKALVVRVATAEGETGLRIEYAPKPKFAGSEKTVRQQMQRIASFVLGTEYWKKHAGFVSIGVRLPAGKTLEDRFERTAERSS